MIIPPGAEFCADNGCFGGGYPGDDGFIAWLETPRPAPGPVRVRGRPGHAPAGPMAESPMQRSQPMLSPDTQPPATPAALAAQNGAEHIQLPWDEFDVLFLGGDTAWKLGAGAAPGRRTSRAGSRQARPYGPGQLAAPPQVCRRDRLR